MEEKNKKRRIFQGAVAAAVVRAVLTGIFILSVFLNIIFLVLLIVMGVAVSDRIGAGVSGGYRKVYTRRSAGIEGEKGSEIAVIHVEGIITDYDTQDGLFGYRENLLSAVSNRLSVIETDDQVGGVLLVIDSPGGGVTASDVLYNRIVRFKEETGLPVVTLMKQVAASGGYYVASASDYILAYPTAITGSIGVIIYSFNFSGLMDRYGVEYVAVKTGEEKDALSPFKPVREEEVAWMQSIADTMLERFIAAVSDGRKGLTVEEVRDLADGRVYIAGEALEKGLIDGIGYYEDAVGILARRIGVLSPEIVEFRRERQFRDLIGKVRTPVPRLWTRPPQTYPNLLYLWNAPSMVMENTPSMVIDGDGLR